MSAKAIFAVDGVAEKGGFEWFESESHIAAKEDKETDTR